MRAILIWAGVAIAVTAPIFAAALSPYLAWRSPIYIAAGFAGILAMALLFLQPLLATGLLPGLAAPRRVHRVVGACIVLAIVAHVAGLWITSPPDVIDALTFTSPTPFSAWGVAAMWAIFATALLAVMRRRWRIRWKVWRVGHLTLAIVIVSGTILHAMLIEGTMEAITKIGLSVLLAAATIRALAR